MIAVASAHPQRRRLNHPKKAAASAELRTRNPSPIVGPIGFRREYAIGFRRQMPSSGVPGTSSVVPARSAATPPKTRKMPIAVRPGALGRGARPSPRSGGGIIGDTITFVNNPAQGVSMLMVRVFFVSQLDGSVDYSVGYVEAARSIVLIVSTTAFLRSHFFATATATCTRPV